MTITLLDNSLQIDTFYERRDSRYPDNVCLRIREICPDEERVFRAEETNLFLTPQEACTLATAMLKAAKCSLED